MELMYESSNDIAYGEDSMYDNTYAKDKNVLKEYTYRDAATKEVRYGIMPKREPVTFYLNPGTTYIVPEGYHTGQSKIIAKGIDLLTPGTATAGDILKNKVAWVNGNRIVGTYQMLDTSGTAKASDLLLGKTAWVNDVKITGTIPTVQSSTETLNCGESYTIPYGLHGGTGKVKAASLASQTPGTATSAHILKNYTAWVNGSKITGSLLSTQEVISDATAVAPEILAGKTAYISTGKVSGTMPNNEGIADKRLYCGESYTVPLGYHDGQCTITAADLASQTQANASASQLLEGRTAWVNGIKITGTARFVVAEDTEGTATEYDIRDGKTAWVNGTKITGKSVNDCVAFMDVKSNRDNPANGETILLTHDWRFIKMVLVDVFKISDDTLYKQYRYNNIENGSTIRQTEFVISSVGGGIGLKIDPLDSANYYFRVSAFGYSMM